MPTKDNSFTITHEFDCPVEQVFAAWTIPELLKKWLAPKDYSLIFAKADIKPDSESHYCMISKRGIEIWHKLFYKDIIEPAKISYTQVYSNEQGQIQAHPMIKDFPAEILTTVLLDEKDGKTTLKLTWEPLNASIEESTKFSDEVFDLSQEWGGTFKRLADCLANKS